MAHKVKKGRYLVVLPQAAPFAALGPKKKKAPKKRTKKKAAPKKHAAPKRHAKKRAKKRASSKKTSHVILGGTVRLLPGAHHKRLMAPSGAAEAFVLSPTEPKTPRRRRKKAAT